MTDPFLTRRGDFKKAYRSRVDNSFQPYRIFVPSSYNNSKPSALIIALHGMGGDENSYFDAYARGAFKVEAERRGYIVACPKGRKPASMYVGDAEKDVMDVIAEVKRDYNIDPDRIYLTGTLDGWIRDLVGRNRPSGCVCRAGAHRRRGHESSGDGEDRSHSAIGRARRQRQDRPRGALSSNGR